jgi:hypothetical protein
VETVTEILKDASVESGTDFQVQIRQGFGLVQLRRQVHNDGTTAARGKGTDSRALNSNCR